MGLWRVLEVAEPRDVEDGAPAAAEQPVCSLIQTAPDLEYRRRRCHGSIAIWPEKVSSSPMWPSAS